VEFLGKFLVNLSNLEHPGEFIFPRTLWRPLLGILGLPFAQSSEKRGRWGYNIPGVRDIPDVAGPI